MLIRQVKINNYRSLKEVSFGDLSKFVIFYGDNDTGKSNILSFLEILFQPKFLPFSSASTSERFEELRPSGFWNGQITNFTDNLFFNSEQPITFSVVILIENSEIKEISGIPEGFINLLSSSHDYSTLELSGEINPESDEIALLIVKKVTFNQKMFFENKNGTIQYLSDFSPFTESEKKQVFDLIMNRLSSLFLRIPADRFFDKEKESKRNTPVDLTPDRIKNWLFKSMHEKKSEHLFREISQQFNDQPFEEGVLSVLRINENAIEIFTEDKRGLKLPIERRGSGVQQILIILSYIINSKSPIIGIEELEINLSPNTQSKIFNRLLELVNLESGPVKQIFLTSHSPHIAKRNEAQRRFVSMDEQGQTKICKPSETEINTYFFI